MLLFVTGTDTDVGKTTVSCALLRAARQRGWSVRGIKPVETGCVGDVAADAEALGRAGDHAADILYKYPAPLSPEAAAGEARMSYPQISVIVSHVQTRQREVATNLMLVEGAGGLLVPLGDGRLIADLAAALEAPLLIVARDGLGTINHTSLTIENARIRGLAVAGFVFSATGAVTPPRATANADAINAITGASYFGRLPRLTGGNAKDAGAPILDAIFETGLEI